MLAGNRHETFVAGHTDAESVKRERARDQLLDHVRERVSLLCRERGLKDLWITKMCQGLRKGRLNSAGFKAGLRHLGCRGFGPGDSDLLFDFCVSHSPDNDHHSDGQGHVDIGFTSFSRVFSPTIRPQENVMRCQNKHNVSVKNLTLTNSNGNGLVVIGEEAFVDIMGVSVKKCRNSGLLVATGASAKATQCAGAASLQCASLSTPSASWDFPCSRPSFTVSLQDLDTLVKSTTCLILSSSKLLATLRGADLLLQL